MSKKSILNPKRGETTFDVAEASEEYTKLFGSNKNLYRVMPSMIDGLKPVQRRILYSMYKNPNKGSKPRKVMQILGDAVSYHPHGGQADVVGNMATSWQCNIPYLVPQGNFGSIRGDEQGAERYIEASLSRFANICFFKDFDRCSVPMKLAYTGDGYEPEYLPARYPTVLFNPVLSSIGLGLASNIPPFNPKEVLEATIKLIKDPSTKIKLIPDSPTGCNVVDNGQFTEINKTGEGSFTLQATYEIDYFKNIITIRSLPLQVTSEMVNQRLVKMKQEGKLDELKLINDDTNNGDVKIDLFLESDANPDKFIRKVMKRSTGLKMPYSCIIRVIDDYSDYLYSPKELLLEWIEYRRECVRSIYNKDIVTTMEEKHLNDIMLMIFKKDNIDKTIAIAKKSKSREEIESKLMKEYGISSIQARAIAGMKVYQFNKEMYHECEERGKKLKKSITECEKILNNDAEIDKIIISELEEGIKLFGGPRRSKIIKAKSDEVDIPNTNHLIGISKDGYIKKIGIDNISIGVIGKTSSGAVAMVNNRENIIVLDSSGRLSRIGVSSIPDMEYDDIGVEMSRYFTVNGNIVAIVTESDLKDAPGMLVLVTENGIGKKVLLSEFSKIKDFKPAITLDDGDALVSAFPAIDTDEFIIYTNMGDGVRLSGEDIKLYGKAAKGLRLLTLKDGEKVSGVNIVNPKANKLLFITSAGRMKMTELKYLPVMKRKDDVISLINLDKNETLVGVVACSKKNTIEVFRKKSGPIKIALSDVPVTSRAAKAEKLVKTPKGDVVMSFRLLK